MPEKARVWSGRSTLLAWVLVATLPFLLANTCFKTTTAPDYVPPGDDSTDADTTIALHAGAPVSPGDDWQGPGFTP
ncbi:hypothetical protein ACFL3B_00720 [Gemmatimonadota bacterium]